MHTHKTLSTAGHSLSYAGPQLLDFLVHACNQQVSLKHEGDILVVPVSKDFSKLHNGVAMHFDMGRGGHIISPIIMPLLNLELLVSLDIFPAGMPFNFANSGGMFAPLENQLICNAP